MTHLVREKHHGILEACHGLDFVKAANENEFGSCFIKYKPKGGEGVEDVKNRNRYFIMTVLMPNTKVLDDESEILVSTHGYFITCFISVLLEDSWMFRKTA